MPLVLEIAARSFRRHLAYRAAALAGVATNLFFGALRAAVLVALFGAQESVAGWSVRDAVTYTGLTQAVIAYLAVFGWFDLMDAVHTGEVAGDLMRPVGLYRHWWGRDLGRALAALLTRGLPVLGLYALFWELTLPPGPLAWAAVALSLSLSWAVSFSWRFLVNLAAFWTPYAVGIGRLAFFCGLLLSGFLMPLDFLPAWLRAGAYLTPFPYMLDVVARAWVGTVSGAGLAVALALQAAWALGLALVARLVLALGVRRLVVLGG